MATTDGLLGPEVTKLKLNKLICHTTNAPLVFLAENTSAVDIVTHRNTNETWQMSVH
jgi:hypothetical protein